MLATRDATKSLVAKFHLRGAAATERGALAFMLFDSVPFKTYVEKTSKAATTRHEEPPPDSPAVGDSRRTSSQAL